MSKEKKKVSYMSLYGVRTMACIGIILMHVLINGNYTINTSISFVINQFTNFVFLFMVLSSFSMCCGYYEKIKFNKISIEQFYHRRFQKIFPFFLFLILIEVLFHHTLSAIIEGFANMTFMFGYLNYNIQIVGVAWFIGLIFLFYFLFPFFVSLFSNKRKAWLVSFIAMLMNFSCVCYFHVGRVNMFYSFVYFCIGGLLFLYKDDIISFFRKSRIMSLLLLSITIGFYFIPFHNDYFFFIQNAMFSIVLLSYAISFDKSVLNNKFMKYIGEISLEIYLSHMFLFCFFEKIHLTNLVQNQYLQYIIIVIMVLVGTILLIKGFQFCCSRIRRKVVKNENINC